MKLPTPDVWPLARTGQRLLLKAKRRETTVDGHRMVFLERGKAKSGAPTLVLLHGFASMKENWAFWMQQLPSHWHLLVPDLPGLGESQYRPDANYGYESQAERLGQWLAGYHSNPLHIAGSSMGGAIAALLAHQLKVPPRTLTLLNSAGIPERPGMANTTPARPTTDSVLIPQDWAGVYRMFNSVGNGKPTLPGIAMTGLLGPDLMKRRHSLQHIFNDMVADPMAPTRYLGNQTPPLQVQWGDRDTITPTRCVDWFKTATPQADIHVFRGVGHLPMLENPRRSAAVLSGFIERHNS
ncbi:MAG: alpha/beta hydrolase [Gammaproteobacteria bacterium]|uniref:Lipase 1 n=1 Tax=Marinobacter litoralis TaxID=187981 RepID=A0A3M2RBY3_9GAMM|nr:alpha/beta hydrolase [Marinobacter litoralis]MBR9870328.1 alpha/beta hydrolase [Gammaproteobacteria bacterium]RMJ02813.1 Lipase 1 precursor [Marinobacter litoralis]